MGERLAVCPSWTEAQTQTVHSIKAAMSSFKSPLEPARSIDEVTMLPTDTILPDQLEATPSLAPPSACISAELVEGTNIKPRQVVYWTFRLKQPERKLVPVTNVIVFIHGGGNTTNSPVSNTYIPHFRRMLERAGSDAVVVAPSYRLATSPENAFPAALQDIFSAWHAIVEHSEYKTCCLTLSGDSSGGNLALALVQLLSQSAIRMPDKIALLAPAGDLTHTLSADAAAAKEVDLFSLEAYEDMAGNYLYEDTSALHKAYPMSKEYKRFPRTHALVSTAHVGPGGWDAALPRIKIWVGSADQLMDASHKIASDLRASGVENVELKVLTDMPHGWWILDCFPQCATTWNELIDFAIED